MVLSAQHHGTHVHKLWIRVAAAEAVNGGDPDSRRDLHSTPMFLPLYCHMAIKWQIKLDVFYIWYIVSAVTQKLIAVSLHALYATNGSDTSLAKSLKSRQRLPPPFVYLAMSP